VATPAAPEAPFDLLLPGAPLSELCAKFSAPGRGGAYATLREPTELRPRELRGLRGLYAFAPFRCRAPAPLVEELHLGHDATIDEQTARCFSGVKNVSIETRDAIPLAWFDSPRLVGIACSSRKISDWSSLLAKTPRRMNLVWTGEPLACLPETLTWLTVSRWSAAPVSALDPIWKLPALETLRLGNVDLRSLTKVAESTSLVTLSINSTASLRGIGGMKALRSFAFTGTTCPPIAELATNTPLRDLSIQAVQPPADLSRLGALVRLESLSLSFGSVHRAADIGSLRFLRTLTELRELRIAGVRPSDGDARSIHELSALKVLVLTGVFGKGIQRLREGRRGRKTRIAVVSPTRSRTRVFTPVRIQGTWSIFDDAATVLSVRDNYAAEAAIRRRLKVEAPELARRIEFDTEAASFSATSKARGDIDALARILRTMARESARTVASVPSRRVASSHARPRVARRRRSR